MPDVDRLVALRDRLERLLEDADAARAPALAKEYRAVMAELAKVSAPKESSSVDEIAARRIARLAKAAGSDAAGVRE